MSAIDQAFIRAYGIDDRPPAPAASRLASSSATIGPPSAQRPEAPPAPHAPMPSDADAGLGPASQRRPLSTFAAPAVEARFRPGLEVDEFRWSPIVRALVTDAAARWRGAVDTLLAAEDAGCSLIGIGGAAGGVGATTIACCLARLLVDEGKTVALVDGDFATAGLAQSLGLAADLGWEDVLAGRVPLADAVIHSLGDRLAVLPLVNGGLPAAEKLDGIHASITAGVLRYHYDIVLFDLGAVADQQQGPAASRLARRCRLDGLLLATAGTALGPCEQQLTSAAPELADLCLGVIENRRLRG